jgi:putative ABC transport system permease protein
VVDLGVTSGDVGGLSSGGLLVHEATASAKGWSVGDQVPVEWPQTGGTTMSVAGIFEEKDLVSADYVLSLEEYDRHVVGRLDSMVLMKLTDGADVPEVQAALIDAARPFADAQVLTSAELNDSIAGEVDQFLLFITALLLLAVFIALMGIVNTLALSVFERTREIGLLRAVGMTRSQVRGMVRWESAIIAAIGAVTGSVVGIGFGVALVTALEDEGVSQLAVPGTRLSVYVLTAAAAGVLAALGPARRASRVDVLTAVKTD